MKSLRFTIVAALFAFVWAAAPVRGQIVPHEVTIDPVDFAATRVDIHADGIPLSDVLSQISARSGESVTWSSSGGRVAEPLISMDAAQVPFWTAIKRLESENGLFLTVQTQSVGVGGQMDFRASHWVLMPPIGSASRVMPPSCVLTDGPVMVVAQKIEHVYDPTVAPALQDYCVMTVELTPEPRLHPIYFQDRVTPAQASDEAGQSLVAALPLPVDPRSNIRPVLGNEIGDVQVIAGSPGPLQTAMGRVTVSILLRPQIGRHRIAQVQGTIRLGFTRRAQRIEIDDAANFAGGNTVVAGISANFGKPTHSAGRISFGVQFDRGSIDAASWDKRQLLLAATTIQLLGPDGSECQVRGGGAGWGPTMRAKSSNFQPSAADGPMKLIVEVPTELQEFDVPYKFSDLPLP